MKTFMAALPKRPELAMAAALIGIVVVLVMPLSRFVLDVLTVVSMGSCLLVLLIAARVQSPVQLLTFPALLLLTTMLRLSLNVASTKMILLEGRAGHVIETFGQVVMGGNLLVGLCVFCIVSVVQFLVVAKGSDRVAEVAARFSLDAMPGKQMSIDGEMRAGTLTPEQASRRRDRLDIESKFFGGMDGAMKFVKGDAIAGLVIAIVNVVGGLASGMTYHGMSAGVALTRYTTLSVGDAMVSQIPSFMIAVAAGLVTTRVTSSHGEQTDLGQQMMREIRKHPSAILYVGVFCLAMALVPSFPLAVFVPMGLGVIAASLMISRNDARGDPVPPGFQRPMPSFQAPGAQEVPVFISEQRVAFDAPLVLSLPRELAERVRADELDARMAEVVDRLERSWGAPFPGLKCCLEAVDAGPATKPGADASMQWRVNGNLICTVAWPAQGAWRLGELHPHDDGPAGVPGYPDAELLAAAPAGGEGVAALETLLACVTEVVCLREQARLLTHEQFHQLMKSLQTNHPQLAEGLAAVIPLPVLTDVVRTLMREGINLRSLPAVADLLVALAPLPQDAASVAEQVITSWSRRRCADVAPDGTLRALMVDAAVEQVLQRYAAAANEASDGTAPDMDAFREVRKMMSDVAAQHPRGPICLLCRGPSRMMVSEMASMASSRFRVFSVRGVNPRYNIEIVGEVRLSEASLRRLLAEEALQSPLHPAGGAAQGSGFDDAGTDFDFGDMDIDADGYGDADDDGAGARAFGRGRRGTMTPARLS